MTSDLGRQTLGSEISMRIWMLHVLKIAKSQRNATQSPAAN